MKVWIYAVVVVLVGAWSSPLFYNAGKALAEVTHEKRTNDLLKKLGAVCARAEFPDFFVLTLIGVAVVLFLPFTETLQLKGGGGDGRAEGQPLKKNVRRGRDWVMGVMLAAGIFSAIGFLLLLAGPFASRGAPEGVGKLIVRLLPWILVGAIIQEWLFRGVVLGIFLRAWGVEIGLTAMAVLLAMLYFIIPPAGMNVPDPDASGVGFELLKMMLSRLRSPAVWVREFLPLVAMGWVLGYARWRTASLWLPAGLHAGWILANGFFLSLARPVVSGDAISKVVAGTSLAQGLVPLVGTLAIGGLVHFLTESNRRREATGE